MTQVLRIDPDRPDQSALSEAAEVIRAGGLVAFATETVYGLGADATSPEAVARIFAAKGRPATNPLIVHVDSTGLAQQCVARWPEAAEELAHRFWPGPLTLVLPRSAIIHDAVTAGLDTVGVRLPDSAVAIGLIRAADRPVAAPSANRSNRVSPTRAEHVLKDLAGRVDLVLDSGPTTAGLESTVVDLSTGPPYRVLRPGPLTVEQLTAATGLEFHATRHEDGPARSPGQLPIHYAPRTPTVRLHGDQLVSYPWPGRSLLLVPGPKVVQVLPPSVDVRTWADPERAAAEFYDALHLGDDAGLDLIAIVMPPDLPEWRALRDRIERATHAGGRPEVG
jgi:L-threonylcarbamoyladenylate synthase